MSKECFEVLIEKSVLYPELIEELSNHDNMICIRFLDREFMPSTRQEKYKVAVCDLKSELRQFPDSSMPLKLILRPPSYAGLFRADFNDHDPYKECDEYTVQITPEQI